MASYLMTLEEAAAALRVSTDTVRRRIRAGRLRAYRFGPRMLRLRRADVEREAKGDVVRVGPATTPGRGWK